MLRSTTPMKRRPHLTPREQQVILWVYRDTSAIARDLRISKEAVEAHWFNIYKKFGVHSRKELQAVIQQMGGRGVTPDDFYCRLGRPIPKAKARRADEVSQ